MSSMDARVIKSVDVKGSVTASAAAAVEGLPDVYPTADASADRGRRIRRPFWRMTRSGLETTVAVLAAGLACAGTARLPWEEWIVPVVLAVAAGLAAARIGLAAGLLVTLAGVLSTAFVVAEAPALSLVAPLLAGSAAAGLGTAVVRRLDQRDGLAIFDALPLIALLYDPETLGIVHANSSAICFSGYSQREIRSLLLTDLMDPKSIDAARQYLVDHSHELTHSVDWAIRRKNGSIRIFEVLSTLITFQGRELRLVVGVDQKARKDLENRLARALDAKAQFLAIVGHELRNPLTAVNNAVQLLQGDPLNTSQRQLLETIRRNVQIETQLVDDMMDYIRGDRRTLRFDMEVVDIHELIRRAAETFEKTLNRARIRLLLDLSANSPFVHGDPTRLQQVLWNLLRNASKFTPPGGEIRINTYLIPAEVLEEAVTLADPSSDPVKDNRMLRPVPKATDPITPIPTSKSRQEHRTPVSTLGGLIVEISDNGLGIEPSELDRIFDPFAQGQTTQRLWSEGLGLGLPISRIIAEAHGGRLTAHSAGVNCGSTFKLILVRAAAPEQPLPSSKQPLPPQNILLVDDHPAIQRSTSELLRMKQHQVQVASNLSEALKALNSQEFDLIISDLDLPDGTGHDLLRLAREQGLRLPPAIVLSGYDSTEERQRSRDAGFALHLVKAAGTSAQLLEAIQKVLTNPQG